MKKFFVVAALLAAFVFASCEQSVLTGADPSANAASALRIAPQALPPTTWSPFHTLPFGGAAPAVRGLATDGSYLVAIGNTGNASASRYDTVSDAWTPAATLTGLSAGNPGLAHYLFDSFLVTVANGASSTGSYSTDHGLTWTATGPIGFGTKAAVYGPRELFYVVAGQNGEAAFTDDLSRAFNRITVATTRWPASSGNAAYINAAAYGDGTYVFGGGSGYIAYTPTILDPRGVLVPWQQAKVPVSNLDFINAMAYGGDPAFVAVGNYASGAGFILYSTDDGRTWDFADTSHAPNIGSVTIYTVTYGNGYFVAVNNAGNAAYSVDGQTWTDSVTSSVFGAGSLVNQTVYYKATNTYIAGGGDTPNGLVIEESN
jgi:hypothetical protein